jgi:Dolichyl-phosphate-mannose-protein mannosyltransferase
MPAQRIETACGLILDVWGNLWRALGKITEVRLALRKAATSLLLILVVGLGARLAFAWTQARKIPDVALATAPFEQETGSIARSIATGNGFSNPFGRQTGPTAWLTPIYPLLVAVAFKMFGIFTIRAFSFLVFLNILFSTAACVPIFYAGKRVAGLGVASASAWLWALFPNAIMTPFEWIWDTSLAALLAATILWATLELAESQRLRDWCGYGLLWGFTLMTNPSLGSLLPFLLGWAAYRSRRKVGALPKNGNWVTKPAVGLGLAILCCVPWTVRNYTVFHRFVPLRSNFPLELYIGNNENYDDKHPRYPGPITKERETYRYFRMGESPFMDEEMRKATKFMVSHPKVELILFGKRFAAFWAGIPNPIDNFLATESWLVRVLILCAGLSGIAALLGIAVLAWRHSAYCFPLATFPIIFPFLYYLTHTSLRYRHPIDPIVLLLTAIAGAAFWQSVPRWRSRARANREFAPSVISALPT